MPIQGRSRQLGPAAAVEPTLQPLGEEKASREKRPPRRPGSGTLCQKAGLAANPKVFFLRIGKGSISTEAAHPRGNSQPNFFEV